MLANSYPGGRSDQVAFVMRQVQPNSIRIFGQQGVEHGLEVRQGSRPEMITLSGLDVELVELGQISNGTTVHHDSGFSRLS